MYEFTETETALEGIHRSIPGPLCVYYSYWLSIFIRLLTMSRSGSLTFVAILGTLFFLLDFRVQLQYGSFTSSYYIQFCHVWLMTTKSLFLFY